VRIHKIIAALIVFILSGSAGAAPDVTAVRIGDSAERTRFVIEMSEAADYRVMTLANPYRLVIDFPLLNWNVAAARIEGEGLIKDVRYGRFTADTSRVVLDLTGPAKVGRLFTLPPQSNYPHRFVVDLQETSRAQFMARVNEALDASTLQAQTSERSISVPQRSSSKRVVVVDAGHGGIDPGALGRYGPDEKHVTLEVARTVRRRLEATGRYSVVMTRDKDVFLPLAKRVEIARRAEADLFISLHCDVVDNRRVRGATVYTLSETASDKEAAALARKENRSDVIAGVNLGGESDDVRSILIDLAQRETMNYSAEFAEVLAPELGDTMVLRTNTHRFAGFRVLTAPDVPSVLVEMGFLSNRRDAQFMSSREGRRQIAGAILEAVDGFFSQFES